MTPEQIIADKLLPAGWRPGKVCHHDRFDRVFYRRFPSRFRCQLNTDKPGIQVQLQWWDWRKFSEVEGVSYSLHLGGDMQNGRHIRLIMSTSEADTVEDFARQLVEIWEAANETCEGVGNENEDQTDGD